MPPPSPPRPCAIGAIGGRRSRPGSGRCSIAPISRSRCAWPCSTSSTTWPVAAPSGPPPVRRIRWAASACSSASTTPGTKAWMCGSTAPLGCCSCGRSSTRRCCATLPAPSPPPTPPRGRSAGISPRAGAGWRQPARWPAPPPTTWARQTSDPSTPPTTRRIRTATSGKTWPVISCCRCGAPSAWPPTGKTCASWRIAGRRRSRPCAI